MNLPFFRRTSQTPPKPPECGCLQPRFCREGNELVTLLYRSHRIGNQYGEWADYQQALVELAVHLDREPSTVRAMVRHPVGTL